MSRETRGWLEGGFPRRRFQPITVSGGTRSSRFDPFGNGGGLFADKPPYGARNARYCVRDRAAVG
jgi:hypothetical protein